LPSSRAYDTASSASIISPRVRESSTPKRLSAVSGFWVDRTSRFLARISARAIRQSLRAFSRAISVWASAWVREISPWRYCQIEVATSPATPMTKVERKVE
jgi:hypothetical protein